MALVALAMLSVSVQLRAQHVTPGFLLDIGFTQVGQMSKNNSTGGNLGASLLLGQGFFATAAFDAYNLRGSAPSGFATDHLSNGQTRCRNLNTGQFASDGSCGGAGTVRMAGMIDASAIIPSTGMMVGGGYRIDDDPCPYVTAGYIDRFRTPKSKWFLRGIVGRSILEIKIGIAIGFR
jgi:hypothetical protein